MVRFKLFAVPLTGYENTQPALKIQPQSHLSQVSMQQDAHCARTFGQYSSPTNMLDTCTAEKLVRGLQVVNPYAVNSK